VTCSRTNNGKYIHIYIIFIYIDMYEYIYMYTFTHTHTHIHIYIRRHKPLGHSPHKFLPHSLRHHRRTVCRHPSPFHPVQHICREHRNNLWVGLYPLFSKTGQWQESLQVRVVTESWHMSLFELENIWDLCWHVSVSNHLCLSGHPDLRPYLVLLLIDKVRVK
jgi:hypothetical protein